ncbi:MAG TPA: hypothetical protein VLH39_07860 [Magnetospirillaceae bacterium]|nr:hypothetical protein [Magnetospirillaceae bacterium]
MSLRPGLVYPVVSRRSGGLSLGIDLFPDRKTCNFDCPYCEVFPFQGGSPFRSGDLDRELDRFFLEDYPSFPLYPPIRDLCLSGSGEPTLSPHLNEALSSIRSARDRWAPGADLVVITNSTTLGHRETAAVLGRFVEESGLRLWAKLDGGGEARYRLMSGSEIPFGEVVEGILSFSRLRSVVIQTMLCSIDGLEPLESDLKEYARLLESMADRGARFSGIHLYTQARPSPGGRTFPLEDRYLLEAAALVAARAAAPVRVFGTRGELPR